MRHLRIFLLFFLSACGSGKNARAVLHTSMGDIRVRLFDSTPEHRDYFLRAFGQAPADTLLFYRIERDFVIQFNKSTGKPAPEADLKPEMEAPLLGGSLVAAGIDSPDRPAHAGFFIVLGRPQTDASLDAAERKRGLHFTREERKTYKKYGGLPRLHGQYSVFGQVTEGIEVAQKIAALPRDAKGQPLQKVTLWVEVEQ